MYKYLLGVSHSSKFGLSPEICKSDNNSNSNRFITVIITVIGNIPITHKKVITISTVIKSLNSYIIITLLYYLFEL